MKTSHGKALKEISVSIVVDDFSRYLSDSQWCPGVRHLPSQSLQGFRRLAEVRQNVSWQSRSETQGQADCLVPSDGLDFPLKVNTQHLLNI